MATAGLIIAAAIHDVGHPGLNNKYLTLTSAPLAIQYNDHSPLENMHLATAFSLLAIPANNFVERLSLFHRKELRRIIISMVLATDNDRHFSLHEKLDKMIDSFRRDSKGMSPVEHLFIRAASKSFTLPSPPSISPTPVEFSNSTDSMISHGISNGRVASPLPSKIVSQSVVSALQKSPDSSSTPPSRRQSTGVILIDELEKPPYSSRMSPEYRRRSDTDKEVTSPLISNRLNSITPPKNRINITNSRRSVMSGANNRHWSISRDSPSTVAGNIDIVCIPFYLLFKFIWRC